jgi:hypothetical protein
LFRIHHENIWIVRPSKNHSYLFQFLLIMCFSSEVPIFQVFYIYSIESFVILTASRKGRNSTRVLAWKSLRSPNGDNSTCPVHPAEYCCRFSPRSVFFNADKQAQDHHARDLRDSPKSFSIPNYFMNPTISPRRHPRDWCRWSDFCRFNSGSAWSSGRNSRERQTNLQLPADHSRSGTDRRRTHSHNSRKKQDIRERHEKLSQAEHAIVEMMEQQLELNCRWEREISELTIAIEGLEQEIAKQKADIAVLES